MFSFIYMCNSQKFWECGTNFHRIYSVALTSTRQLGHQQWYVWCGHGHTVIVFEGEKMVSFGFSLTWPLQAVRHSLGYLT